MIIKKKYSLIVANRTACIFFPKFDTIYKKNKKKTPCNDKYFSDLKKLIVNKINIEEKIILNENLIPFFSLNGFSTKIYDKIDTISKRKNIFKTLE